MKKLLLSIIIFAISSPCFPALTKDIELDGYIYSYLVIDAAVYDRGSSTVIATLNLYKDQAYYLEHPEAPRKTYTIRMPFSKFPVSNLLNVQTITEAAIIESVLDPDGVEINEWSDATVVVE